MAQESAASTGGWIGRVLGDGWRIDGLIARGGIAGVFRASKPGGQRAAIKVLHGEFAVEDDIRKRFLTEGLAANSVGHSGVVRVLGQETTPEGFCYLVMELLEGELVEDRRKRLGGRLSLDETLSIIDQLLDVLSAAHKGAIVHRDIKPENLFLLNDGTLKVLDFGIAHMKQTAIARDDTVTGYLLGTPDFMSPEQALGKRGQIDAQTDIWGVGATMFTLLSGETVHDADSVPMLLVAASSRPARSLSAVTGEIPRPVVELVDRALAFDKPRRWPSARAMQDALRAAATRLPGTTFKPREAAAAPKLDDAWDDHGRPERTVAMGVDAPVLPPGMRSPISEPPAPRPAAGQPARALPPVALPPRPPLGAPPPRGATRQGVGLPNLSGDEAYPSEDTTSSAQTNVMDIERAVLGAETPAPEEGRTIAGLGLGGAFFDKPAAPASSKSPLASTAFGAIDGDYDRDAETVAFAEGAPVRNPRNDDETPARTTMAFEQDAHVVVGPDEVGGDEATLAVPPEALSSGAIRVAAAQYAESMKQEVTPSPNQPAYPPAPYPPTSSNPIAGPPYPSPRAVPAHAGWNAPHPVPAYTPDAGVRANVPPSASFPHAPMQQQPHAYPPQGWAPPAQKGGPASPEAPARISGQMIVLFVVGTICIAIFIVGIYLFVKTR